MTVCFSFDEETNIISIDVQIEDIPPLPEERDETTEELKNWSETGLGEIVKNESLQTEEAI